MLKLDDLATAMEAGKPIGDYVLEGGALFLSPNGAAATVGFEDETHGIYHISESEIILIDPVDGDQFGVNWDEVDY